MSLFSTQLSKRFIAITGPDSSKFLQGQTSCDISELNTDNFSYSTFNTPKGRMYCLFKILKTEHGFLLSMDESLLDSTLQKLSKYAVFFKCELEEDLSFTAFGITASHENDYDTFVNSVQLGKKALSVCLKEDNAYFLNMSPQNMLAEAWIKSETGKSDYLAQCKAMTTENWLALETKAGIPEVYNTSQEEFILQSLNLHHLGAVSFKKGCYTGQEIIARMKFLGKQKKQAYLIHSQHKCVQPPLEAVYDKEGAKCGTIIRSHWSDQTGSLTLCILPIEKALDYKTVFLNKTLDIPFSISEIDYSEFNI